MPLTEWKFIPEHIKLAIKTDFTSTPYAKPKWISRLYNYVPANKDLKELYHSTWLEF